jgi:hypothetical protein
MGVKIFPPIQQATVPAQAEDPTAVLLVLKPLPQRGESVIGQSVMLGLVKAMGGGTPQIKLSRADHRAPLIRSRWGESCGIEAFKEAPRLPVDPMLRPQRKMRFKQPSAAA